jgi:hypothetical protein
MAVTRRGLFGMLTQGRGGFFRSHLLVAGVATLGVSFFVYRSWAAIWASPQRLNLDRLRTSADRRRLAGVTGLGLPAIVALTTYHTPAALTLGTLALDLHRRHRPRHRP